MFYHKYIIPILRLAAIYYLVRWGYWQLNDEDSWFWVLNYWVPAGLIIYTLWKPVSTKIYVALLTYIFVTFLVIMPKTFESSWIELEEGREALGLFISGIFVLLNLVLPKLNASSSR